MGTSVALGAFALYIVTAARDIVLGDTPELTAVALTFGVAHPPGYPLFTMLGWVFGQLPVGPPPFRIALLSVVCHAATVGVVFVATCRFTRSVPAAAVSAVALATEPIFWAWSLVPEVFPLADLLAVTTLLLAALWHERPEWGRLLVGAALLGGLGMAHQQTIALVAPAILYLMWRRRDSLLRAPFVLAAAAAAFVAGLVPYLALLPAAARDPTWSWGDLRTAGDLFGHVLRLSFGTASLTPNPALRGGSSLELAAAPFVALDPVQWLLLAAGAVYAWRKTRWYAIYLLAAFIVAGPVFTAYTGLKLSDDTARSILERFFLMPHAAVAPLAGFAVLAAEEVLVRARLRRRLASGLGPIGVAAALAMIPLSFTSVDRSGDRLARTFASDVLDTLKPGSLFLTWDDHVFFPIRYLQTIEGVRPDVRVVLMPAMGTDWYVRELRRTYPDVTLTADRYGPGGAPIKPFLDANSRTRPIADTAGLPDNSADADYRFSPRGLLYDVRTRQEAPALGEIAAQNESILATYHPPRAGDAVGPFRAWYRLVLAAYGTAYLRVGNEYESAAAAQRTSDPTGAAALRDRAKEWYRRALTVDPLFTPAKEAFDRVSR